MRSMRSIATDLPLLRFAIREAEALRRPPSCLLQPLDIAPQMGCGRYPRFCSTSKHSLEVSLTGKLLRIDIGLKPSRRAADESVLVPNLVIELAIDTTNGTIRHRSWTRD